MAFKDEVQALIDKIKVIKTKAGSLAALTAGYRQKYRAIFDQATDLNHARLLFNELNAELETVDGQVAEAVAANTDENDNGIPDRDEPPAAPPIPPVV